MRTEQTTYDRDALCDQLGIRPEDRGKGAMTKLTEADWAQLATHRRGAWVVAVDDHCIAEGPYLIALGSFFLNTHAGDRVKMVGHTDFVQARLAAALLES
jgi:hypothetical protein